MTAVITAEGGRLLRAATYAVVMLGGAWSLAWPSQNLIGYGSGLIALAYAGAMLLGGIACLIGAVSDRWMGELIGLPLVVPASAGLTVVLAVTIGDSLGRGTVAFVALTCTMLLADRWRGVIKVERIDRQIRGESPNGTGPS